ncbi:hypothetical protein [Amycolatopsis sp. NPDC001319]|uniref:hypothetical protein n=1 Tax=unclassified Amycolatopsis TaxID=2618356 RepID=UPI0036C6B26F
MTTSDKDEPADPGVPSAPGEDSPRFGAPDAPTPPSGSLSVGGLQFGVEPLGGSTPRPGGGQQGVQPPGPPFLDDDPPYGGLSGTAGTPSWPGDIDYGTQPGEPPDPYSSRWAEGGAYGAQPPGPAFSSVDGDLRDESSFRGQNQEHYGGQPPGPAFSSVGERPPEEPRPRAEDQYYGGMQGGQPPGPAFFENSPAESGPSSESAFSPGGAADPLEEPWPQPWNQSQQGGSPPGPAFVESGSTYGGPPPEPPFARQPLRDDGLLEPESSPPPGPTFALPPTWAPPQSPQPWGSGAPPGPPLEPDVYDVADGSGGRSRVPGPFGDVREPGWRRLLRRLRGRG